MAWLQSTYTIRLNQRHQLFGHVFGDRYRAQVVEDSARGRQEFEGRMEGKLGEHHAGEFRRETTQAKGERIMAERLAHLGWQESGLEARCKSNPDKLAIAARLRRETTLSIKAIAAQVRMGTSKSAKAHVHQAMREITVPDLNQGRFRV
jgi:hypothetical protein